MTQSLLLPLACLTPITRTSLMVHNEEGLKKQATEKLSRPHLMECKWSVNILANVLIVSPTYNILH